MSRIIADLSNPLPEPDPRWFVYMQNAIERVADRITTNHPETLSTQAFEGSDYLDPPKPDIESAETEDPSLITPVQWGAIKKAARLLGISVPRFRAIAADVLGVPGTEVRGSRVNAEQLTAIYFRLEEGITSPAPQAEDPKPPRPETRAGDPSVNALARGCRELMATLWADRWVYG